MRDISNIAPLKILVCQLRQIGDVLLATPAIKLLKERFPQASLHVLTEKKCAAVLQNNPRIDKIWEIDKQVLKPITAIGWYVKVGRQGFDLIVDFQQLPRCKWVVGFSGAPIRLTFTPPWYNRPLYTHWCDMEAGYAAKAKASVLTPLGIKWDMDSPELFLSETERQEAKTLLDNMGLGSTPFITIDPSHRRETRRWLMQHFIEFLRILEREHPQLKALILWGPGEKETADKIAREAASNSLVPKDMLSLRHMAAVQERAVMHFGNCSSPRHFAVAVGTPSVTIQGATKRSWCFPSDDHLSLVRRSGCHFCNKNTCALGTRECLVKFLPEQVYAGLSLHLQKCLSRWEKS